MEQELKDHGKFKDFYQFTFNFAKNPGQKGLGGYLFFLDSCFNVGYLLNVNLLLLVSADLDMAIAYWNLILAGRFKFLDLWNTFLLVSVIITLLNS